MQYPVTDKQSALNVADVVANPKFLLTKPYTKSCEKWFKENYPGYEAFLTSSCTRALEMAALSMDVNPGDEIIVSPFNYVGVANAFAMFGAKLVFVDIEPNTMNIDLESARRAITAKTKAIIAMHYGSVACDLDGFRLLCDENNLFLVEDAAHCIGAKHQEKPIGLWGDFSAISFDAQKNISCGEGGVLLVKQKHHSVVEKVYENGTDKRAFDRGDIPLYSWQCIGSKFAISEYDAAVLLPLLQKVAEITCERRKAWDKLFDAVLNHDVLSAFLPKHLNNLNHNGHVFWLCAESKESAQYWVDWFKKNDIQASFHYPSLDDSPFFCSQGNTTKTNSIELSGRLFRLPLTSPTETIRNLLALSNT